MSKYKLMHNHQSRVRNNNNNNNNNNKTHITKGKLGQIEIFGLAFIVIIISIGFFIFLSFRNQPQENPQKEFTNDKMASDFIMAISEVTIDDCPKFNVKDLIIDCAGPHQIDCNGLDSCIKLNNTVNLLLNKTFVPMNAKLRLYSENLIYDGKELLDISYRNCTSRSQQGRAGTLMTSLYPTPTIVYININLCSQ